MTASDSTFRPPIGNIPWETLFQLVSVPPHNRERFAWWVSKCIEIEQQQHAAEPPPTASRAGRKAKIDADIAKAGRAFIRAIERRIRESQVTSSTPGFSAVCMQRNGFSTSTTSFSSGVITGSTTPSSASSNSVIDWMMIKRVGEYLRHVKKPPRGAPSRAEDRFKRFVRYLLYAICALGGRPSFNRKTGGNVVELLEKLRDHMPAGFIPRWKHPPTMIEDLCTHARVVTRAIASHMRGDRTAPADCPE